MTDVYIDEVFIGTVEKPREFIKIIREERRLQKVPSTLNILYNEKLNEVYIEFSKGRAEGH